MQQLIQQATVSIKDRLPDKKAFYSPEELYRSDIPDFVVDQICVELEKRLEESLEIPMAEWADLKSRTVARAWERFVESAKQEIRLPAHKANTIIQSALQKLIPQLIHPRIYIPEYLFGNDEKLTLQHLKVRVDDLTVNRHLAQALLRYMEKKDFDTLEKDHCKKVASKIDERLTARYDTEKWIRALTPLFELVDGEVPSEILANYFHNRGKTSWSRYFAEARDVINKDHLREWLNQAGKRSVNEAFTPEKEESGQTGASTGAAESGDRKGTGNRSDESTGEETQKEEKEVPIWQRYMSGESKDEELEENEADVPREEANAGGTDDEGTAVNEIFEETDENLSAGDRRELEQFLEDQRSYFIKNIFRGSEKAFEKAVSKLAARKNWEEAYHYIDREIFERHNIDIYSEPAVYFTDKMQNYFQGKLKAN